MIKCNILRKISRHTSTIYSTIMLIEFRGMLHRWEVFNPVQDTHVSKTNLTNVINVRFPLQIFIHGYSQKLGRGVNLQPSQLTVCYFEILKYLFIYFGLVDCSFAFSDDLSYLKKVTHFLYRKLISLFEKNTHVSSEKKIYKSSLDMK